MKHTKKARFLAAILAAATIVTPGTMMVSAEETDGSDSSNSSSSSYETTSLAELLSVIDYTEYLEKHNTDKSATKSVELSGDSILAYNADITNAKGVQAFTLDDGKKVLYLPSEGTVGWTIDVPETGMYNLAIVYYPVEEFSTNSSGEEVTESKTTSIERTFYINGKVSYYEARFLTMTKSWTDDVSTFQLDENGNPISTVIKDGKTVYAYVDADGNVLKHTLTDEGKIYFEKTGEKVDLAALAADGCERYYVYKNDIDGNQIKTSKELITSSSAVYHVDALNMDMRVGEAATYYAKDSSGYYIDNLQFYLTAGSNDIALEAQRESMAVASIALVPVVDTLSYEEYLASHSDASDYTGEAIKIQAEFPSATSENTIYATNDRTSYITEPQNASAQILNTIGGDGGEKWKNIGQWVRWEVDVPETGWYQITLRFKQSVLEGTFSSRTLRVATASMLANGEDAVVPFNEAQYLQFNYDDKWQVAALNDGTTTFKIYLEKGTNQIELEASLGNMAEILRRVEASMNTVNSIYLQILMITGTEPDANTDYGFYRIMPDEIDELLRQAEELYNISELFAEITGKTGSHAKTLDTVGMLLERMGADVNKVASNIDNLKENLGTLGTWVQESTEQPLQLDYIVFEAPETDVKKAHQANDKFYQSLWYECVQFVQSFVSNYNTMGSLEVVDEENKLEVWTTLGRDQAMIIRNLINSDFNQKYPGISVELKLVAGGSLLPSVLAGVGPDVSMGHGSGDVMNWAIRSAVVDLSVTDENGNFVLSDIEEVVGQYDETLGFLGGSFDASGNFVNAYFTKAAVEPLELFAEYQDGTTGVSLYGLPEAQSFSMMFYRADVFYSLGISVPTTWDELIAMLPVLQNNNMEIAMPNSQGGLNLFLYQMGGDQWGDNGKVIGYDSDVAVSAFDYMCSFFYKHRCPYSYSFVNRFRTGEMPLGIVDYTTYTQLAVYATEIKGMWEFVALPGIISYNDDGTTTINNTSVSGVSALIMLHDEDRTEEQMQNAWKYMKWYVGADNQSEYANELTALLGTVSKHNTANVNALASLSWTTSEYNHLMSQFTNLSAVREYPGSYIIARYISFAFLAVYNDNADPTESLLDYIIEINKEITRKRKEFDLTYTEISYSSRYDESKAENDASNSAD